MAENIEILFEDVLIDNVIALLSSLDTGSNLLYLRGTSMESDIADHLPSRLELKQLIDNSTGHSFYFRFSDVQLFELQLPDAGIQVYSYDNIYDLSIDFAESYFDRSGMPINILQASVGALAHGLKARLYCCGYEPVFNLDYRFFTNSKLGPLGIPYHIEVKGKHMVINLMDIIFRGEYATLNLNFLKELLLKAKEVRFSYPEISTPDTYDGFMEVFHSNSYADLAIITDHLEINNVIVPHVFINLTRDENEFELLFYFDIRDYGNGTHREKLDELEKWARSYSADYGFNYFVCQINNANLEEYYFDSEGHGPLYD
jgi:hypothetical protein